MTPHHTAVAGLNSHCAICGQTLSFHQRWAGDICNDWRCRWTRLDRELEAHRQAAAGALGVNHPEAYGALVVPHRPGTIESLPSARRAAHLRFLNELVMEFTPCDEEDGIAPVELDCEEPPIALAEAVCAACGGACCHRGGNQAFLETAAIERVIAANPGIEPLDIVRVYASFLPLWSFADSCVYHSSEGCTLPRSLRAHICNAYRCSGLKQAERRAGSNETTRVYVVARKDNTIMRGAFVEPDNIRHYPPMDEPPDSGQLPNILQMRR